MTCDRRALVLGGPDAIATGVARRLGAIDGVVAVVLAARGRAATRTGSRTSISASTTIPLVAPIPPRCGRWRARWTIATPTTR